MTEIMVGSVPSKLLCFARAGVIDSMTGTPVTWREAGLSSIKSNFGCRVAQPFESRKNLGCPILLARFWREDGRGRVTAITASPGKSM